MTNYTEKHVAAMASVLTGKPTEAELILLKKDGYLSKTLTISAMGRRLIAGRVKRGDARFISDQ